MNSPAIPISRCPIASCIGRLRNAVGPEAVDFLDATRLATALMGDSIATNPFLLGYAWQKGMIPLSDEALLRAIELNGTAVEANKQAFALGPSCGA